MSISGVERLSLPGYQRPRLQTIARELGIRGYSRMNRATLIAAILARTKDLGD